MMLTSRTLTVTGGLQFWLITRAESAAVISGDVFQGRLVHRMVIAGEQISGSRRRGYILGVVAVPGQRVAPVRIRP